MGSGQSVEGSVSASFVGTDCLIDGQPVGLWDLTIHQEAQMLWSSGPRLDKEWSATDTAGHFHAYNSGDDHFPTLLKRIEEVPCYFSDHDEDCDSANITHYHCRICDEEMTPGVIHGDYPITIHGTQTWSAEVLMPSSWKFNELVSLRGKISHSEVFGVAKVVSLSSRPGCTSVSLVGIGPLGYR